MKPLIGITCNYDYRDEDWERIPYGDSRTEMAFSGGQLH